MIGPRIIIHRGASDEAEKPFWISFADLMTAMMVLFLVVMAVSLLSVTQKLRDVKKEEIERAEAINKLLTSLQVAAIDYPGIEVSKERMTVDFGSAATFSVNDFRISEEGRQKLLAFVPKILHAADTQEGRAWLKRVVVEGFTDTDGTYLHNLQLSLMRAESVVCTLLNSQATGGGLSAAQMERVRELFLVGGFSSNSSLASKQESRRVELRLDFRALNEVVSGATNVQSSIGKCQI